MANTKRTPGYWRALRNRTVVSIGTALCPAKLICDCRSNDETTQDEADANARLIAAAPELLAALREIAKVGREDFGYYGASRMTEIAERAIAKAEG